MLQFRNAVQVILARVIDLRLLLALLLTLAALQASKRSTPHDYQKLMQPGLHELMQIRNEPPPKVEPVPLPVPTPRREVSQ
jgi:hypothetical protein